MTAIYHDETLEDLQINGLKLIQNRKAFRFGMDAVLLADFARIHPGASVCDFGAGNGVLPILLIGRNKGSKFYAFEIQASSSELAERNMRINHLENVVTVFHDDVIHAPHYIPAASIDCVIMNPPYGIPGKSLINKSNEQRISRIQDHDTIDHFLSAANLVLKGKGRLSMIYPAQYMLMIMNQLKKYALEPKRFQLVYSFENKPARFVLIEAIKGARPLLHPEPPLIIYHADGTLTNKLKSIYHID